jgi:hypothetical protein
MNIQRGPQMMIFSMVRFYCTQGLRKERSWWRELVEQTRSEAEENKCQVFLSVMLPAEAVETVII